MDDIRRLDPVRLPADVAALCRIAEEVPGVRLAELLSTLTDPDTVRHTYDQLRQAVMKAAQEG